MMPASSLLSTISTAMITSCRCAAATICLRPLQVDSIFIFIRQVAVLFRHNNIFVFIHQVAPIPACWLFKTSATTFELLTLKLVSRDTGYLCANFSLPRPLCSRVGPKYATDVRQTDVRQKHRSMPPPYGSGGIITMCFERQQEALGRLQTYVQSKLSPLVTTAAADPQPRQDDLMKLLAKFVHCALVFASAVTIAITSLLFSHCYQAIHLVDI